MAIADDNERMAEILDHILKQDSDFAVVGIAHNGEEMSRFAQNVTELRAKRN